MIATIITVTLAVLIWAGLTQVTWGRAKRVISANRHLDDVLAKGPAEQYRQGLTVAQIRQTRKQKVQYPILAFTFALYTVGIWVVTLALVGAIDA